MALGEQTNQLLKNVIYVNAALELRGNIYVQIVMFIDTNGADKNIYVVLIPRQTNTGRF